MQAVSHDEIEFAKACQDRVAELNPLLIRLYEGYLAEGGWDPDPFLVYFFARKQGLLRGCTNFAVVPEASSDGETIAGRNYDWAYSDLAFCEARVIELEGALPFVSYTHHWVGHPDCLNDAGLFIAISSLPRMDVGRPGIQWNLLVDTMAMTCATVAEAIDLLTNVVHLRAMTYLLADRTTAAAVEASDSGTVIRYPDDGIVVATNHVVGKLDDSDRTRHSVARYDTAFHQLSRKAPGITRGDVETVLKDPVCTIRDGKRFLHPLDHVPLSALENWGTIWSTVCRPGRGRLDIAAGHPQDVPFQTVDWK